MADALMDAGSALLASVVATVVFVLVLTALRALGRTELDVILAIGRAVSHDREGAFVAGVISAVALGALEALALAAIWGLTGWPIAPLQGSLMALAQWPIAQRAVRPVRGGPAALFLAMLGYGATLGLVYAPGI